MSLKFKVESLMVNVESLRLFLRKGQMCNQKLSDKAKLIFDY